MQVACFNTCLLTLVVVVVGNAGMSCQSDSRDCAAQETFLTDASPDSIRRNLARSEEDQDAIRELFVIGDEAVPPLVNALRDPDADLRTRAARGLVYIGDERGIKALESAMASEKDIEARSAMSYVYGGGLVPATDREFLEDLILIKKAVAARDPWNDDEIAPAFNAALALAATGRSDALPALREFKQLQLTNADEIAKAMRWIENRNAILPAHEESMASEEEQIRRFVLTDTFFGQSDGDETSVECLTFNRRRTKVLVSLRITGRQCVRGYDLVLAKPGNTWNVMGIWFTWLT